MPLNFIKTFFQHEAASGLLLGIAALVAIIWANSPFALVYQYLQQDLQFFVNEGLMTLFFLLVGLELKREFFLGTLGDVKQIMLPAMAALGGMVVPALIYIMINYTTPIGLRGWSIPVATDIAFALGVLSLFGKKVPISLKLFLMALAIFDDMGAVLIIVFFKTHALSYLFLTCALLIVAGLACLNRFGVLRLGPYLLLGLLLWFFVFKAGIHPTIAGIVLAFFIPLRKHNSPLQRLENNLHGGVAYLVMPVFALLNAGLSFQNMSFFSLLDSVTLGIALGLVVGKQIGVFTFTILSVRWGHIHLPKQTSWLELYGVALLCGIGFTMSLFLGTLAFAEHFPAYLSKVRLGVLTGSLLSGLIGATVLHIAFKQRTSA